VADADPPAPHDLPAPYVNPWGLLRRDLLAVIASLRLELWQLWRRNRQGDLPRPRFWPQTLAGWFWPALLAVLLVAGGRGLLAVRASLSPGPPPSRPASENAAPGSPPPMAEPAPGEPAATAPSLEAPALEEPDFEEPALEQPPPEEPLASAPPPDPLLEALAGEEQAELLQAARVREPDGGLELVLERSGWQHQAPAQRQRLAEQWQRRAAALGHERLWLLDPQGAPLGRSARVGSGMILLAPSPPADDP
jgi:hypothetical protein